MLKPALRERLLGALVFLCLGLIFYPAIFDTRNEFIVDRDSQIPEQLVRVEPMVLEEPVIPDEEASVPKADEMFVPPEEEPANLDEAPSRPSILDDEGVPNAWILQAGSFAAEDNANDLEQRLLAAGFRAYIRRTENEAGEPRYRVFVGPYLDRAIAQADSSELSSNGFTAPLILEFEP